MNVLCFCVLVFVKFGKSQRRPRERERERERERDDKTTQDKTRQDPTASGRTRGSLRQRFLAPRILAQASLRPPGGPWVDLRPRFWADRISLPLNSRGRSHPIPPAEGGMNSSKDRTGLRRSDPEVPSAPLRFHGAGGGRRGGGVDRNRGYAVA